MNKTAHYFASKAQKYVLIVNGFRPTADNVLEKIDVSGKAEARKVAAQHNAKPWNF